MGPDPQGGERMTFQPVYKAAMHWGVIIAPNRYTNPIKFDDAGNPYGYSRTASAMIDTDKNP